jgi:hypothetical protein
MRAKQALLTLVGTAAFAAAAPATALDLVNAGDSGFVNGAFFQQVPDQSTGTGVIEPFLRVQANGTEQGFNTSVNQVKVYRQATGNISTLAGLTNQIYSLDGAGDTFIRLNYDLNPGSGAGDMFAYIPVTGSGDYFYLYSQFGTLNASNDGFEEWATVGVSQPIPEPETYALMMAGLGVMGVVARRRKKS